MKTFVRHSFWGMILETWATHTFFSPMSYRNAVVGTSSFSPSLLGPFYKKVAASSDPSGAYYSSLVVINHGRVSIPTQRLPRVSSGHSLTVSNAISFLSTCPLPPHHSHLDSPELLLLLLTYLLFSFSGFSDKSSANL